MTLIRFLSSVLNISASLYSNSSERIKQRHSLSYKLSLNWMKIFLLDPLNKVRMCLFSPHSTLKQFKQRWRETSGTVSLTSCRKSPQSRQNQQNHTEPALSHCLIQDEPSVAAASVALLLCTTSASFSDSAFRRSGVADHLGNVFIPFSSTGMCLVPSEDKGETVHLFSLTDWTKSVSFSLRFQAFHTFFWLTETLQRETCASNCEQLISG